jgi:DNA-binding LytR/AlgR family response regulator
LRYLIKPINPQKIYEAIEAALVQAKKMSNRLLKFKTENGVENIPVNQIICTEAHAHYQHITLMGGKKLRVRATVTELFATLSKYAGFIRIGSAYIINLRHVKNVSSKEVSLYDNVKIQIPRGKYTEIKEAFWNFQYEEQGD